MQLNIIIPTYNEELMLPVLLPFLLKYKTDNSSILIVDGNSNDKTLEIAKQFGVEIIASPQLGRANQMNYGASLSNGDVLYFIHADTLPEKTFYNDIKKAIDQGFLFGSYRTKFDSPMKYLFINEWFTQFNPMWCRGGDQTLFFEKHFFHKLNGYNNYYTIMEEYDLMRRADKDAKFCRLDGVSLISARKYTNNNYFKVMYANYKAFKLFNANKHPNDIKQFYKNYLSLN